jgi:methyl-accepting chemotaxis protein
MIMGAFGAFTLAAACFSGSQTWLIDAKYSALESGPTHAAFSIARANRALTGVHAGIADLVLASSAEEDRLAKAELDEAKAAFNDNIDSAIKADPANASDYQVLQSRALEVLDHTCADTIKAGAVADTPAAALATQALYKRGCASAFPALIRDMKAKALAVSAYVDTQNDALTQVTKGAIATTFALILGGLAIVMVGGFFGIRAWVASPIKKLSSIMDRLAKGDLQACVEGIDRGDELGAMSRAVQVFKDAGLEKQRLEAERRKAEEVRAKNAKAQAQVVSLIGAGLEKLSSGDLTYRLTETFATEYEKLRADFNAAMAQLQGTMKTVVGRAHGLRSGGAEISQASDDLSKRTEQQAASLEETAAALDQITATVKKTADGTIEARKVVASAKADAETSAEIVREAVSAMSQIEESSRQIGQIIGVIDEIAFQTNLLALNAGVEAARAGDAGRGFAVVASEVRALAQRSAEAAKEIKALISASSNQVAQGVDRVGETGKALDRIAGQVAQINHVVAEIAASAQEQATGLHEVNSAMNQMDQVTQQNAAMVEQATAAAHSLLDETDALSDLISQFRVGDTAPVASAASRRTNPVHVVQKKIASVMGGGRRAGSAAVAEAVGSKSDSWEEF